MDNFEESVMSYLCGRPERFISPQFNIPYAGLKGGSCPDFVVLDFKTNTIHVAEVTIAADSRKIMYRLDERLSRWFEPLRTHFQALNPAFSGWDFHVTLFVRNEELERARSATTALPDVSVISLDDVAFSWRWKWLEDGTPEIPLREVRKLERVHGNPAGQVLEKTFERMDGV